jgi:membrane protein DedA with SNARE-associated domain
VASDLALYGIGIGARYMPWLSRLAVNQRVLSFGDTLKRNLYGLAALGRVVPGAIFVIMVACGWTRVAFTRVALASVISSALYLPLMLYLVVIFGDALDDRVGLWTWPFLLGVVVAVAFMRYRVFKFGEPAKQRAPSPRYRGRTGAAAGAALAARYRARSMQLPHFMRLRMPPRTARGQRLH